MVILNSYVNHLQHINITLKFQFYFYCLYCSNPGKIRCILKLQSSKSVFVKISRFSDIEKETRVTIRFFLMRQQLKPSSQIHFQKRTTREGYLKENILKTMKNSSRFIKHNRRTLSKANNIRQIFLKKTSLLD